MTMNIVAISTELAPAPFGHYSQAVVCDDLIYVSGQLGVRPDSSHTFDQPFQVQAHHALENMLHIVEAAGGSRTSIIKVTAYIVGVRNWIIFNQVYGSVLGASRPARSVVPVPELHHGYLAEIDAVARQVNIAAHP